jgi:hypothetical protein
MGILSSCLSKVFCIVETKHYGLQQGMAQDLVGMEIASDVDDLDVVYGIVPNYISYESKA